MLAYEHVLRINLPRADITKRLDEARAACDTARFGACNVLRIEQHSSSATLQVRIAPEGVEPLTALAAKGGSVGMRHTNAEDLADAVGDNRRQSDLLQQHAARLAELAARKDITVADLITLSREQAEVETRRQALEREAATQQRRLDTNRLELRFEDVAVASRGPFRGGLSALLDELAEGTADALRMLGYGLPFLILGFPLALAWRALWRRFSGRRKARPEA